MEPVLPPGTGWIEVICGGMFSGKTEELLRRVRRAQIAGQKVALFKPDVDTRYHPTAVVSHDQNLLQAQPVPNADAIYLLSAEADVVAIDEGQFFDEGIVSVSDRLADEGKRVIIAGLDMDYRGRPFGPMPYLMAIAEFVTKLHAVCKRTGLLAHYSYRKVAENGTILPGGNEIYEPLSRKAFCELGAKYYQDRLL
ncbi:MAG: thymidine kinase [Bacteroidia bacterium]|nr:thymidine kinase [Bacteroidia bacterium]MCX7764566.1 thymidine kinase [Bacteroidia bacterium]MDW8058222.1 thymidine kinase [Bacteroidia bacterium]